MSGQPILEVQGLSLNFDGVQALDDVSFDVAHGELLALIGPNGAGKTSVFNCVTGVYRPNRGRIAFEGREITGMKPHRVARHGVIRTFQNVEVFESMTVLDNLLLGRFNQSRIGVVAGALWEGWAVRDEIRQRRKVEEVIDFLEIEAIRHQPVGSLPFGLQKRVELGRALATEPRLLLLDEPVAGMNQEETEDMVRFVLDVKEDLGVTVVLVEHDMGVVMQISDRICVLDFGQVIAVGGPDDVERNKAVRAAYLGGEAAAGPGERPAATPQRTQRPWAGAPSTRASNTETSGAAGDQVTGPDSDAHRPHDAAAHSETDGGDLDGVAGIVDLLVADLPLPEVLAACAALIPDQLGSAAVVAMLDGSPVTGAPAHSPAEQLCKDDRWWYDTTNDGRCRAPADFAGLPTDLVEQARAEGFRTAWTLPLYDATTDEVIGCLAVWVRAAVQRTTAADDLLRPSRRMAAYAIREERRREALRREATTDPLTGLANRTELERYLATAGDPVTVAVIDLDEFKPVNDAHGHPVGDAVLQIVAERLVRAVRETDLVVRLGGDEFAVVFADRPAAEGVPVPARRITDTIEEPIQLGDLRLSVSASVGIATAAANDVVRQADAALYEAKRTRKSPG